MAEPTYKSSLIAGASIIYKCPCFHQEETWLTFLITSWRLNRKNNSRVVADIHRLHLHQSLELQRNSSVKKGPVFDKSVFDRDIGCLQSMFLRVTVNVKYRQQDGD